MSLFRINRVSVSVDVSDKCYGTGESRSVHLSAESPMGEGLELEKISEATSSLMDMFLEAYRGVHAARFVSGEITGKEFNHLVERAEGRISKIKGALSDERE